MKTRTCTQKGWAVDMQSWSSGQLPASTMASVHASDPDRHPMFSTVRNRGQLKLLHTGLSRRAALRMTGKRALEPILGARADVAFALVSGPQIVEEVRWRLAGEGTAL